jgi:hypothetical protein
MRQLRTVLLPCGALLSPTGGTILTSLYSAAQHSQPPLPGSHQRDTGNPKSAIRAIGEKIKRHVGHLESGLRTLTMNRSFVNRSD